MKKSLLKVFTALGLSAIFMLSGMPLTSLSVFAAAKEKEVLTVEKATQWAVGANSSIKNTEQSYVLSDDNLQSLKDSYLQATTTDRLISIATQIMKAEMDQAIRSDNMQIMKEKMKLSITGYFSAIIREEKSLELYDLSLDIKNRELGITRVKNELGLVSKTDYDAAKNSYNQLVNERQNKVKAIDNAYMDLNRAMGRDVNNRYQLTIEDTRYTKLGNVNLPTVISVGVNQSPTIKDLANKIDIAKYEKDVYSPEMNITIEQYEADKRAKEIALDQAGRNYDDGIKDLENKIISTYNSIQSLEISYDAKKIELEKLQSQLKIKETELELGKITQLDLDNHKYSILVKEEEIRQIVINHAIESMKFKNTNLL